MYLANQYLSLITMGDDDTQVVTPWEVEAGEEGIDYDKLIRDFGSTPIEEDILIRMEKLTGKKVHPWLKRGIFFSHRDLGNILDL